MRFTKSIARLFESLHFQRHQRAGRRRTPRFPIYCEQYEAKFVLSAPNILNVEAPTQVDEGTLLTSSSRLTAMM